MINWIPGWRDEIWSALDQNYDLIVIGGGITGGGIFLEAVRAGFRTLLLEANDFASGTSSRSSKLVHGGFRYLRNGQIGITYHSVRERERLLHEGRGLINQIGFIIASYKRDRIPMWALGLGLTLYDLFAFKWSHKYYPAEKLLDLCPNLNSEDLIGGYRFLDALTDDARLVLRTIKEGVRRGGYALNYARVERILHSRSGKVVGVVVRDMASANNYEEKPVHAKAVINATGAWVDELFEEENHPGTFPVKRIPRIRRLRGSHLVFSAEKLPLTRAISIWHPKDKRPVFTFPWEGVTLVGTTDVDYRKKMETDPAISPEEVAYLLQVVNFSFPSLNLIEADIQSTFSGIRSVVDTGKKDPSKESREHLFLYNDGLLTVIGGKLTTFHLIAHQALNLLKRKIPEFHGIDNQPPVTSPPDLKLLIDTPLQTREAIRLIGRYGQDSRQLVELATHSELLPIEKSGNLWAEIRWAAKYEGILHLEDLLLRRVRIGNILPGGGLSVIDQVKSIVQEELNWDNNRWTSEVTSYKNLLAKSFSIIG